MAAPLFVWGTDGRSVWAWGFAIAAHGTLLAGLFSPNSDWIGPILTKFPTREKQVWLTIDDGPSSDTIPLAEMLGKAGVHATFFLKGKELQSASACLESIEKNGHTIANHTQNHPLAWFWIYPPSAVTREIDAFGDSLRTLTSPPCLPAFRCPAGVKNPFLHAILLSRGLTLVGWTVRAYDGVQCDHHASMKRILSRLTPGAILLVHEGKNNAAGQPASVEFIRELVAGIKNAGYQFV